MTTPPLPGPARTTSRSTRTVALATVVGAVLYLVFPAQGVRGMLPPFALAIATAFLARRAGRADTGERAPWVLAATAGVMFVVSGVLVTSWSTLTGQTHPWPGPAHLVLQVGMLALIGAIVAFVRARRGRDLGAALDAIVVGTSVGGAVWVLVVVPMLGALGTTPLARAVLVILPLLHVALLVATWRLMHETDDDRVATTTLAAGMVVLVVTSGGTGVLALLGLYRPGGPLTVGWVIVAGCLCLVALHPSARELTKPAPRRAPRSPARRIAAPAAASLVLPTVLLVMSADPTDVVVAAVAAAVLVLVTVRVWLLLREIADTQANQLADQRDRDHRRFQALVRHTADVLLVLGPDGTVSYASPSARKLFEDDPTGWSRDQVVALIHPDERTATTAALHERLETADGRPVRLHARFVDRDGREQHGELVAVDLLDDPDVRGVVITIHETTARAELEAELRQLAFHDALTGLPNRELFQDRLAQALSRAARTGRRVAVLLADLDDFKDVNDTLGHPAGDQLLQELGARLSDSLRATDTVARLGGDEFAVLCEDLDASRDAVLAARRVLGTTDHPIEVDGRELLIGMSVGVAVDTGERSADELLRDADVALYEAKAQGKQRWSLHRATMTVRAQARLQLAADLARAVADDQLDVAFQPIHSLVDNTIVAVEALARWDNVERGPVPADEFIGLAEQNGLILRLGDRVLNLALSSLRQWLEQIPDLSLRIGVNVSARQLRDPKLVARIGAALDRYDIPAEVLTLELTESVMLADPEQATGVMRGLRGLGVRFAVDDFGTGYSSLSYLRQLPVDIVKIDRSFIRDLTTDRAARDLVRAIVELGRGMGLDVHAEGVETEEQRDVLSEMGCDHAQGYLFDRPLSASAMGHRLCAPGAPIVRTADVTPLLRPTGSDAS